jgi:hypothetical protein
MIYNPELFHIYNQNKKMVFVMLLHVAFNMFYCSITSPSSKLATTLEMHFRNQQWDYLQVCLMNNVIE